MKKMIKQYYPILYLASSILFIKPTGTITMLMMTIGIYLFVYRFERCKYAENEWVLILTGLLFIPRDIVFTNKIHYVLDFFCEGIVSSISTWTLIYIFIFSVQQIVIGCIYLSLNKIESLL